MKKVLALHGFRTSGDILSMQTAAFKSNVGLDLVCINAPHEASGPCDFVVQQFYPSNPKFEWFIKDDADRNRSILMKNRSLQYLINIVVEKGPFDGILGFSQGSSMLTILLEYYRSEGLPCPFQFAIIIAGVEPALFYQELKLSIKSLHLIGENDELNPRSRKLSSWYTCSTVIVFNEGHNIPSMRTGVYPEVKDWLENS